MERTIDPKRLLRCGRSASEILFFAALILYCAYSMLANITLFYEMPEVIQLLRKILRYVIFFLLIAKFLVARQWFYDKKLLASSAVIALLVVIEYLTGGYSGLVLIFGLVLGAYDIDITDIIKVLFVNIVAWGVAVSALSLIGVLNDYTYFHVMGNTVRVAHSLGFSAYNHLGFMAMAASLMWVYLRRQCSYLELAIIAALNYLFYLVHTTRLPLIVVFAYLIIYILAVKMNLVDLKRKFFRVLAAVLPTVIFTLMLLLQLLYMVGGLTLSIPFLSTVIARFRYSAYYIDAYGIHLFGTKVEMNSIQDFHYGEAENSVYIDNGYIYALIAYGVIFFVVILLCYTLIFKHICATNDVVGYLTIAVMLAACCVNNFLLNVVFNPALFALPHAIRALPIWADRRKPSEPPRDS